MSYSCVSWKDTLGRTLVSTQKCSLEIKVNFSVSQRQVCANRSSGVSPNTTVSIAGSKWGVLGRYLYIIIPGLQDDLRLCEKEVYAGIIVFLR